MVQKNNVPLQRKNTDGAIAQLVEQRTENPCVPGSIPGGTTKSESCIPQLSFAFSSLLILYIYVLRKKISYSPDNLTASILLIFFILITRVRDKEVDRKR